MKGSRESSKHRRPAWDRVYWAEKYHAIGSGTVPFGWSLLLFGPREEAERFLALLGIGDMELHDSLPLKKKYGSSSCREKRPRVYVDGVSLYLEKDADCTGWLVNPFRATYLDYLGYLGMLERKPRLVTIDTQADKARRMLLKQGALETAEEFVKQFAKVDREKVARAVGWNHALRAYSTKHRELLGAIENGYLDGLSVSARVAACNKPPEAVLPRDASTFLLDGFFDEAVAAKWQAAYAKQFDRIEAVLDGFADKYPDEYHAINTLPDYHLRTIQPLLKKIVK